MDCGPKEIEKAGTYIPLGKWVATQMMDNDSNSNREEHTGKRGKTEVHDENIEEISVRVDSHPCREQ